jgi:hypothetical protein
MTSDDQLLNKHGLINMCSPSNQIPGEKLFSFLSLSFCIEWNVRGAVGHVAWLTERSYLTTRLSIQDPEDLSAMSRSVPDSHSVIPHYQISYVEIYLSVWSESKKKTPSHCVYSI